MKRSCIIPILLLATLIISCVTDLGENSGTGHDGEMKVLGSVCTPDGKAINGLDVRILPSNFNPTKDTVDVFTHIFSTNSSGQYEFSIKDTGFFTISAYHESTNSYLYLDSVMITDSVEDQGHDTLKVGKTVHLSNQSYDSISTLLVYLLGTDIIVDTIQLDTGSVSVPSDNINIIVSDAKNDTVILFDEKLSVQDSSDAISIIIKDSSGSNIGTLSIEADGMSDSITITQGDTLATIFDFSKITTDSIDILRYGMNWGEGENFDSSWSYYDSSLINFSAFSIGKRKIVGSIELLVTDNQLNQDTLIIYSNEISLNVVPNIYSYEITLNGRDTGNLFDTLNFEIETELDTLDTTYFSFKYTMFKKKTTDTIYDSFTMVPFHLVSLDFKEFGTYEAYLGIDVYYKDNINNILDSFYLTSDTVNIIVPDTSIVDTNNNIIKLYSNKSTVGVSENVNFHIEYFDTSGDTSSVNLIAYSFNFTNSDSTIWDTSSTATYSWWTAGTYQVIGKVLTVDTMEYSDTLVITVTDSIIDTIPYDTMKILKPYAPTGAANSTINSNRYYVTNSDPLIFNGDTLAFAYRFAWNDTLADSSSNPDTSLADFSPWDSVAFVENSWDETGIFFVRVQKRLIEYPSKISPWSEPLYVKVFASQNDTLIDTAYFTPPQLPIGDDTLALNQQGTFISQNASCVIPGGVQYRFDWGDSTCSKWSNDKFAQNTWDQLGTYKVKAQARSVQDTTALSTWSNELSVIVNSTGRKRR